MKYLLYIFSIMLFSSVAWSQGDSYQVYNSARIKLIDLLIKEDLKAQKIHRVELLQKEQKIRQHLDKVYRHSGSDDYIIQLQTQLLTCDCVDNLTNKDVTHLKNSITGWNKNVQFRNDNFVLYTEFLLANYINTASNEVQETQVYDSNSDTYGFEQVEKRSHTNLIGFGFRIGSSFYFNKMKENQSFKIGFDLLYFSFIIGVNTDFSDFPALPSMIVLNLPQPGVVLNKYFNATSGLEMRGNIGFVKSFGFNLTGMGGRFSARYWTHKLSVGIDYQYSTSIGKIGLNTSRIHQVGLSLGMRF